jgi:cyanophycinase
VDQHFGERNRIGRLLAAVASSPSELGMGVDEDTAAEVDADGALRVLGRGTIVIVDGHEAVTNAAEAKQHLPLLISGVRLHVLPHGQRFSLRDRTLLPPAPDADQEHRAAPGSPPRARAATSWDRQDSATTDRTDLGGTRA